MGVKEWNYLPVSSFVCVYFLFLGFQYACTSIYFYWKALLFQKLQLCKYYLWENGWKQLQSIFMKRKWNILGHEILGFLVNEETSQLNFAQTCCLISNSSSFMLYFFLNYACMYIWSFMQLAYLLKLIFWKIWIFNAWIY